MINAESYNWENVQQCPLCSEVRFSLFDKSLNHGVEITNLICHTCGLVFQSPRMDEESIEHYYQSEYIHQHQKADQVTRKEQGVQAARAKHLVDLVVSSGLEVGNHLDIGASTGRLMKSMIGIYGCQSFGVEPSEVYRAYANQQGLNVYASLDELEKQIDIRFNLITLAHVLEHLPEPRIFLEELKKRWLEEDGAILVEVPNLYFHQCFELPHLASYQHEALRDMLKASGCEEILTATHGYPRSRRIPLYLVSLARPELNFHDDLQFHSNPYAIKIRRWVGRASYKIAARIISFVKGRDAMRLDQFYERLASENEGLNE